MAFATCPGDCDSNGVVKVDEVVRSIGIALDRMSMDNCTNADNNGDGTVTVDELTMAVSASLQGCDCADSATYPSTFAAIQDSIFDRYGCGAQFCHSGPNSQGGLDLTGAHSYEALMAPSTQSTLRRILPGDKDRSYLYLKLAAKTDPALIPEHTQVNGAPMPNNQYQLTKDELEAMRVWIYAGAPETGTVNGTQQLLNACLPDPKPIIIEPLAPPAQNAGVQLVMPEWDLPAKTEKELCFATYYDISAQVPDEFKIKDENNIEYFRFDGQELRQDPQSHHLILNLAPEGVGVEKIHDQSFGEWTCIGGDQEGDSCEPTDTTSCGAGICTSEIKQSFACVGFGPRGSGGGGRGFLPNAIGGAQKAQANQEYAPGVFAQIPTKGILYWNSHAFNLTDEPTKMHARLNYYFADQQQHPLCSIFDASKIFSANAPPYTTQEVCNDHELPSDAKLFSLSSHTHQRGKRFWITGPNDEMLYENFIYNDPPNKIFDPAMFFENGGTLHYCALYNNGVGEDGLPDPETVTRRSRTPDSARETIGLCRPTACAAGKVGEPCNFKSEAEPDNQSCDTAPNKGDGLCDACRITGGESTQNEMFILIGSFYREHHGRCDDDPSASGAATVSGASADVDELGRSTYTGLALPSVTSCGSSHAAHAEHAGH